MVKRANSTIKGFPTLAWLGLCASLVLFAGCAGHRTDPRTANLLDDKVITERVEVALKRASPPCFAQVRVDTARAVVTLRGFVPNPQAKEQASQIAQGVQKVRQVDNELQVR